MDPLFIDYSEALALKELGYKEKSLAAYTDSGLLFHNINLPDWILRAPLYQQAFDFLRNSHALHGSITPYRLWGPLKDEIRYMADIISEDRVKDERDYNYTSYEQARSTCLKRMVEVAQSSKSNEEPLTDLALEARNRAKEDAHPPISFKR